MSAAASTRNNSTGRTELLNFLRDGRRRVAFDDVPQCGMMICASEEQLETITDEEFRDNMDYFACILRRTINSIKVVDMDPGKTEGKLMDLNTFYVDTSQGILRWIIVSALIDETYRHYVGFFITPGLNQEFFLSKDRGPRIIVYHEKAECNRPSSQFWKNALAAFRNMFCKCRDKKAEMNSGVMSIDELAAALDDKPKPQPKKSKAKPKSSGGAGAAPLPMDVPGKNVQNANLYNTVMKEEPVDEDPCNIDE